MVAEALCTLLAGVGWFMIAVSLAGILYELIEGVRK